MTLSYCFLNKSFRPQSTNVPSVALAGGKRDDSAKQQIRLAEKEQKLFETQEYIQVCATSKEICGLRLIHLFLCLFSLVAVVTNEGDEARASRTYQRHEDPRTPQTISRSPFATSTAAQTLAIHSRNAPRMRTLFIFNPYPTIFVKTAAHDCLSVFFSWFSLLGFLVMSIRH